jgi:hypothetical protein
MAFAAGRSFVILQSMAQNNPEAQKLLDDLNNISQEDFEKRFGELLGNNKSADKEPEVGDVDDLMLDAATDNLIEKTIDNPLEGIEPIDEMTSFTQPKGDTKQTKSALEGIKGMDYEPIKYVYERVKPLAEKISSIQKEKFDVERTNEESGYFFSNSDEIDKIVNDKEMDNFIEDVINKDAVGLNSHAIKYFYKYEDYAGDGDSRGTRNVFLQEYMKPIYKKPKVLSKEQFAEASKGKKILYRGVESKRAVENTLFGDEAWYMYSGAKGDGIYMSDNKEVARQYASYGLDTKSEEQRIMKFIVPDDFKTIDNEVLHKIGRKMSHRISQKIKELAMGKLSEEVKVELDNLERLQNYLDNTQYTAIATALGFDGVEVSFVEKKYVPIPDKPDRSKEVYSLYKNMVLLNLEKLTAEDVLDTLKDIK